MLGTQATSHFADWKEVGPAVEQPEFLRELQHAEGPAVQESGGSSGNGKRYGLKRDGREQWSSNQSSWSAHHDQD